jgi:hypothetical protein
VELSSLATWSSIELLEPVSLHATKQNLTLLDKVCFIPFRRAKHEVDNMLLDR